MSEPLTAARWVEVIGGRFECPHCGCRWVGTWRGPRELMTCLRCERPLDIGEPRGYPPEVRTCPVCGKRVLLRESFHASTVGGVRTVTHTSCERAARA